MWIPPAILSRRAIAFCAATALAAFGILAIRGCHDETPQITRAPKPPKPRSSPTSNSNPSVDNGTWSRRYEERKAPPDRLVPDAAITRGELDNGFRFILAPQVGEGDLSLRLLVMAGSIHETDAERGYAHFVEHLAFMGRRSRREGGTLEAFESFGAASGADANAHTARDHTLYRLDLSGFNGGRDEAFDFFRDIADGLLFLPQDVDSERRIVLREMDEREAKDLFDLRAAAILPVVPAAGRAPIGLKETITQATPAALRDFWERTYVPSRMILCVAGDFDRETMAAEIRRRFGSLRAKQAVPDPEPGDPLEPRGAGVAVVPHPAEDEIRITIAARQPLQAELADHGLARLQLMRFLAAEMLENRLSRETSRRGSANSPPQESRIDLIPGVTWREIHAELAPPEALPVMAILLADLLSARDRGFTELEFAEARGEIRQVLRENFSQRLSEANGTLSALLIESARRGTVIESPEDALNRARTDLATITRAECENLLRDEWQDERLRVVLSGSVDEGMESAADAVLMQALADGRRGPPDHPAIRQLPVESFGTPGTVTRQELDTDRGFLEAEFANGVLVRLQPMPSLGGAVSVAVDLGHGKLAAPLERPGLPRAAASLVHWYPMEGFRQIEYKAALADRELSSSFSVRGDCFRWRGDTDRDELDRQLQVIAACIARPGVTAMSRVWRPDAEDRARLDSQIKERPQVTWKMLELLEGGDPRMEIHPRDYLNCDSTMVAGWLAPVFREGRLRVSIAGDFDPQQALAALAVSFGALPQRAAWEEAAPYPALPETAAGRYLSGPDPDSRLGTSATLLPLGTPRTVEKELQAFLLRNFADRQIRVLVRGVRGKSYSVSATIRKRSAATGAWLAFSAPCDILECESVAEDIRHVITELGQGRGLDNFPAACRLVGPYYHKRFRNPEKVLELLSTPATYPSLRDLDMGRLMAMEPEVLELAARVMVPGLAVELQTLPPE